MAASQVLVDNAAGQTALQALAAGLPMIGYRPIPGHGADGVRHIAGLGLSDRAPDERELLSSPRISAGCAFFTDDAIRLLEILGLRAHKLAEGTAR